MTHRKRRAPALRLSSVSLVGVLAAAAFGVARLSSDGTPTSADVTDPPAATTTSPAAEAASPTTPATARSVPASFDRAADDQRSWTVEQFGSSSEPYGGTEPVVVEDMREPASDNAGSPGADAESAPAAEPVRVVLWGDSIAAEATQSFHAAFSPRSDVVAREVVWPGIAICDALPSIATMSRERSVDVAVIEFSGNAYTPCTIDPATGEGFAGDALIDRYEADVTTAIELLVNADATVLLAGAPPVDPDGQWAHRARVADLYREVAARFDGVRFVDTGATLSSDDGFTNTLRCLSFESQSHGCVDGWIQVRHDDGLHIGLGDPDVWSSGSYRYGTALAKAASDELQRRDDGDRS